MLNFKDDYNVKGVKHVFYPDIFLWQYIEREFRILMNLYCYDEIKLPVIEKTFLFTKSLGINSDIIKKEMFSFKDNKDRDLTLLPEGTTSCLKSLFFDGFLRNFRKQNVWYISPMFRKENPQKGRHRLFYQIGIESFGEEKFSVDLEHIIIINRFFNKLSINNTILEINYIDNTKNSKYKEILKCYFLNKKSKNLDENILNLNPLLFLDKIDKNVFNDIPASVNFLENKNKFNFIKILYFLKIFNIFFVINKFLVRGLDYYNNLIYEWVSFLDNKELTVCAGGRYDNLSNYFGDFTYGTGCALGVERSILNLNYCIKKKKNTIFLFENNFSISSIFFLKELVINEFKNFSIYIDFVKFSLNQKIKKIKKKDICFIFLFNKIKIKENKIIFILNKKYKIINLFKLSRYIWKKKINL